jgi:SAM-dependent methyltransferase
MGTALRKALRKLKLYGTMVLYANAHNREFANENYEFYERMRREISPWISGLEGLRILDLGCGKSFWLTLLLHSCGAQVTGIDTEVVEQGHSAYKYLNIIKKNGFERALRTLVWDMFYARPYYQALAEVAPFPLSFQGLDARSVEISDIDIPAGSLDLIVSHEVFEHLSDVEGALVAMRRLLKPEGIAYIYIHNFASLSGGHQIAWKYPDTEPSVIVPPWDHLRENLYPDIPSWINRMREVEYRRAFEREFEVLSWLATGIEGEALLTSEISRELFDYSTEELLTKGFTVIARPLGVKPAGNRSFRVEEE